MCAQTQPHKKDNTYSSEFSQLYHIQEMQDACIQYSVYIMLYSLEIAMVYSCTNQNN